MGLSAWLWDAISNPHMTMNCRSLILCVPMKTLPDVVGLNGGHQSWHGTNHMWDCSLSMLLDQWPSICVAPCMSRTLSLLDLGRCVVGNGPRSTLPMDFPGDWTTYACGCYGLGLGDESGWFLEISMTLVVLGSSVGLSLILRMTSRGSNPHSSNAR